AAPGVDHASTTGMRNRNDSAAPATAIPMQSAVTAELVSSTDAPTACGAETTNGTVPPKPTSMATSADDHADSGGRRPLMRARGTKDARPHTCSPGLSA